jgi:uncharacterized protein YdhG (YjbR/CyaY superfamily)
MPEGISPVDQYIEQFEGETQATLRQFRDLIREEAPDALEKISYGMPTFYLKRNLVHFAVFKDHYGFFPGPSGIEQFLEELNMYRTGKGTLSFRFDETIPWQIIRKVVRFRAKENLSSQQS